MIDELTDFERLIYAQCHLLWKAKSGYVRATETSLSERYGVPRAEVRDALSVLLDLDLLSRDDHGNLRMERTQRAHLDAHSARQLTREGWRRTPRAQAGGRTGGRAGGRADAGDTDVHPASEYNNSKPVSRAVEDYQTSSDNHAMRTTDTPDREFSPPGVAAKREYVKRSPRRGRLSPDHPRTMALDFQRRVHLVAGTAGRRSLGPGATNVGALTGTFRRWMSDEYEGFTAAECRAIMDQFFGNYARYAQPNVPAWKSFVARVSDICEDAESGALPDRDFDFDGFDSGRDAEARFGDWLK